MHCGEGDVNVSMLLRAWSAGDKGALPKLMPGRGADRGGARAPPLPLAGESAARLRPFRLLAAMAYRGAAPARQCAARGRRRSDEFLLIDPCSLVQI